LNIKSRKAELENVWIAKTCRFRQTLSPFTDEMEEYASCMDDKPSPHAPSTISISTYRKLLRSAAEGLSDAQVAHIRDVECQFADAIIEFWLREKNSAPRRSLPNKDGK
jgi:hypothetical protein